MNTDPTRQLETLRAQVDALTRATGTGVFRLHLDDLGGLSDLGHAANWLAMDPRLIARPAGSPLTIADVLGVFDADLENLRADINNAIAANNHMFMRTTSIQRPNGGTRWLELRLLVEHGFNGMARRLHGVVTDRTREQNIDSGLQDLGEFLNKILLEVPVAIFRQDLREVDPEIANVARISGSWMINASALYGLPKDTIKSPIDTRNYMHPDDREKVSDAFNQCNARGLLSYEVEYRTLWPDGSLHWLASKTFFDLDDNGNKIAISGIQYDITDRKLQQERIEFMAGHDVLTDLPNRALFQETLDRAIAGARRYGRPFALLYVDLDNFKHINDSLGHDSGDRVLVDTVQGFRGVLRGSEFMARLGGDEFVVIAEGLASAEQAAALAERLIGAATRPVELPGTRGQLSASIGICIYAGEDCDGNRLLRNADMAMYQAKKSGGGCWRIFDPSRTEETGAPMEPAQVLD